MAKRAGRTPPVLIFMGSQNDHGVISETTTVLDEFGVDYELRISSAHRSPKRTVALVEKAASSDEIALAGKGFNEQVEGEFKKKNPNIDFKQIDRMEKIVVSQNNMQQFLKSGGLSPKGGS